jgi:hypothetical protein
MGGHPSPAGLVLLKYNLLAPPAEDDFVSASVWADLAQHLRRVLFRMDHVLQEQHARYRDVRRDVRDKISAAEQGWVAQDPLAENVDWSLLNAIANVAPVESDMPRG